ncbi:MAG: hypothetical protein SFZ23_16055 [Planctomycetota bacterium]|nr:hypothetical protein [Planctomycetota bacterium]
MSPSLALVLAIVVTSLAGCSARIGGSEGLDKVADELRAENAALKAREREQTLQIEELRTKLAEATRSQGAERLQAPALAALEIDSLSGSNLRENSDATSVVAYVRTLDGRGRFLPASGTMLIRVLDAGGGDVASASFDPEAVRNAYRSSFAGTHYTFEVDLPAGAAARAATLDVRLTDGVSGREFAAVRSLNP